MFILTAGGFNVVTDRCDKINNENSTMLLILYHISQKGLQLMSTEINISTGNLVGRFNCSDGSRKMERLVQNLNIFDLCLNLLSKFKKRTVSISVYTELHNLLHKTTENLIL